jgi:hypothetical protein
MRLAVLLFIGTTFIFFPALSFASYREQIINDTLNRIELAQSAATDSSTVYSQETPADARDDSAEKGATPHKKALTELFSGFYASAGFNANHMHYKELEGGTTLDEEYGKLTGFYLVLGYRSKNYVEWLKGKPFIEGYFKEYDALITYDGQLLDGTPYMFENKSVVKRLGVKVGGYADFSKIGEILGYFDLGNRTWYRGEDIFPNYAEKYSWTYLGFGIGFNFEFIPKLSTGIDMEWMFSPSRWSVMRANLDPSTDFQLGGVFGAEVKFPLKYQATQHISFDVTPYFTYWDVKHSGLVNVSGYPWPLYEPDSKTHIEGVLTGVTYKF